MLLLHTLDELNPLWPGAPSQVAISIAREPFFILYTINVAHNLLYQRIACRQAVNAEIGDQSQRMPQAIQRLSHPCKPVYDVRAPSWIIILASVSLHPLAFYVDAAGPELVWQVHIIRCDPIVPVFAGWA